MSTDRLCQVQVTEAFRNDRTGNYELMRAEPGRARSPANVEQLRGSGLEVLVFPNSTNRHIAAPGVADWDEIEAMVRERIGR